MATRDPSRILEPQPDENVAPESFNESHAFAGMRRKVRSRGPAGNPSEDLFHQQERLFHFANADPDAGVDVALFENRHLEAELVIRRIGKCPACIECAPRRAADIASGTELTG